VDTPEGERRNVAALVADVADSTAIGERIGPERSKFLFDEIVRLMSDEVRRFDGTVAQLTGDGLFAVFGAPVAHEDDSERAVRAALAIHAALAAYAGDVEKAYGIRLAARVAVNSGPVVLVREELPDQARYNALGDTVNVAARLQVLAGDGGVAVGPATARQVERHFTLEPLGEVELKGKEDVVAAFRVIGEREAEPAVARTPLVDREPELATLEGVLQDAVDGRGAIVSVTGEAGIGKTRLVDEVEARFAGSVRFLHGHAVSYAEQIPYWPVRDLLRDWLGLGVSDPEARARLELKAGLAAPLGGDAEQVYPFIAGMLGLTLEPDAEERVGRLSRENVQQQTVDAARRLLASLSAELPLCLVLEDLHWADESTLDLVEELFALADEEAVALVLLYRSEREHRAWDLGQSARRRYPHRYHDLELQPLDADASRAVAANAAGAELPEAVGALIADRAGGNPFFLEEALRDLVERGLLKRQNNHYELAVESGRLVVPAAVQETLQARLERLQAGTREVLNVAAVVGRDFGLQLLERVAAAEGLRPALSELQRLDLIVEERRRPAPEYRFRHGLVQEVAYASLVEPRRRELHLSVGRALQALHEESPAEAYGLLAWHFSEADEAATAADYLLKAGDAARALYANDEALERYGRALHFLERIGETQRAQTTLFKIALTHHIAFDFERAGVAYEEAFAYGSEARRLEPSERLEMLMPAPNEIVPGYAYYTHECWFTMHLFRGLLRIDGDLNVVPDQAESFSVSADGRTYRFRLRPDACWSDGVTVSAEDFASAWREMRAEGTTTSHLLRDIAEVTALDAGTLELRLHEPRNFFPFFLAGPWCFPWPGHRRERLGDAWREPANLVGNGPFVLAELDRAHALLTASPTWTGPRGNVSEALVHFDSDDPSVVRRWRRGEGDLTVVGTRVDDEVERTVVELAANLSVFYLAFDLATPPFDDSRVRKAFVHGLDRDVMVDLVIDDAPGLGGLVPPAMPGHSHRIGLPYDPALAAELLASAGHPRGAGLRDLTLTVPDLVGSTTHPAYLERMLEQWSHLGLEVEVRVAAYAVFAGEEQFPMWSGGWEADFPDPEGMLGRLLDSTRRVYRDDEITDLLERGASSRDQDERLRLYREVDRLLVAERTALAPLTYGRAAILRRPWVEGAGAVPMLYLLDTADRLVIRR
jgi:ABC-type transport system substrate-binding protein/class 3 adenylate cyclase